MSRWSIETLSTACAALLLILLGWLAGVAWQELDFRERVSLALLLLAACLAIAASKYAGGAKAAECPRRGD